MPHSELVSPLNTRTDSGHQLEALMVSVDDYNYGQGFGATAATAPIFQQHTAGQDKVKSDTVIPCFVVLMITTDS
jgi:transcription factor TGA